MFFNCFWDYIYNIYIEREKTYGQLGHLKDTQTIPNPKPTVDGGNPAPVDMLNIPLFTRFHTSQVVQDFFHQQYYLLGIWEGHFIGRKRNAGAANQFFQPNRVSTFVAMAAMEMFDKTSFAF